MKKAGSVVVALSISLFIYVFYRSEKTVVNELIIMILSFDTYAALKSNIVQTIPLSDSIVYALPGGLWVFCATALSQNFYLRMDGYEFPVVHVPAMFAVGLELCQLLRLTRGTFDFLDVLSFGLFWLLAVHSFKPDRSCQNTLSPFTVDGFICLACFFAVFLAHVNR